MKKYCIVGIGSHSKKKLIPSIENIPGTKYYIVSNKIHYDLNYLRCFKNINEAIKSVEKDTIFIISTPPQIHFEQCKKIIKHGYDIIVEKPAFLNQKHFNIIKSLISSNQNFLVENLMYQHNKMYYYFLKEWKSFNKKSLSINIKFTFPSFPANSFRDNDSIYSSCLYDVGCYPISFLINLGFVIKDIEIIDYRFIDNNLKYIKFKLTKYIYNVVIEIGFKK